MGTDSDDKVPFIFAGFDLTDGTLQIIDSLEKTTSANDDYIFSFSISYAFVARVPNIVSIKRERAEEQISASYYPTEPYSRDYNYIPP